MARQAALTLPSSWDSASARNRNRYRASSVVKAAPPSRSTGWSSERMRRLSLQVWEVRRCRYNSGIGHPSAVDPWANTGIDGGLGVDSNQSAISVRGLAKKYGPIEAVAGIDFEVSQ